MHEWLKALLNADDLWCVLREWEEIYRTEYQYINEPVSEKVEVTKNVPRIRQSDTIQML